MNGALKADMTSLDHFFLLFFFQPIALHKSTLISVFSLRWLTPFSFLFLTSSLKLLSFLLLLPRHLLLYLLFIFQAFFLITLSTGWLWFLLLTHVCCTLPLPNPLLRYPPLPQVSGKLHQTNGITRVKSKLELWTLGNSFYPQGKSSFRWSNCIHSQMLTCIPAQTHAFKILSSFQLP